MSDLSVTINGQPVVRLLVNVPNKGPWYADCDVPLDVRLTGRVTIKVGTLTLVGTVVLEQSGSFQKTNLLRVRAGGGGWGRNLAARGYHNDAGVSAALVAADAAHGAGETLGTFEPVTARLGNDYVRNWGPASRALEDAAGDGVAWWVDYAGVTHVGPRPEREPVAGSYTVLTYNPRERSVVLSVLDPALVTIGHVITQGLDEPGVVRELQLSVAPNEVRMLAWLGGAEGASGRLTGLVRSIVERVASEAALFGCYRYRVIRMAPGPERRVELQPVSSKLGLPELSPVSQWPGVPGMRADLDVGAEVLVQFADGDREHPVVTHYAGPNGIGFVPVTLVLGGDDGPAAARQQDAVEVLLPPAVFSGTVGPGPGFPSPVPATGVVQWMVPTADGVIVAGSAKVRIA
jgi:hypothetical protein